MYSVQQIKKAIAEDASSIGTIAKEYMDRIIKNDQTINALTSFKPEVIEQQVKELEAKAKSGQKLGALAGVPVILKDNIHDMRFPTTCASKILENYTPSFDATVTTFLREADAIIMGKANQDEFAMGSSSEHGYFGSVKNPWDTTRSAGGSSGGSAAAIAAGYAPISLGSDTGGSIRQPASFCGVVGLKPTYGRVSRSGLVAFGSSLDQIGPMANSVQDIAASMEVLGRHCDKDSTSSRKETFKAPSFENQDLKGKKIGVPREFLKQLKGDVKTAFDDALATLEDLGATLIDIDLSLFTYSIAVYYIIANAEASTNLARFDGIKYGYRSPNAQNLSDVYCLSRGEGFGAEVKRRIMLGTFVLSAGYQDAYYKKALKVRRLISNQYMQAIKGLDSIVLPTSPTSAFALGEIKDPLQEYLEDIFTIAVNLVGVPALSLPYSLCSKGLPIGIQLIGKPFGEADLLSTAYPIQEKVQFSSKRQAMKGEV